MVEIEELDEARRAQQVEIVVDRIVVREDLRSRLADSLETAQTLSENRVAVLVQAPGAEDWERHEFTFQYTNPETGFSLPKLTPKHFSFNSHAGACPTCHGLGTRLVPDPELIVPDPDKSLNGGGVKTWWSGSKSRKGFHQRAIEELAKRYQVDPEAPLRELPREFKKALLYGDDRFEGLATQANRLLQ